MCVAYLPKGANGRVFFVEQAAVVRVPSEIVYVDRGVHAAEQDLQFLLVEHPMIVCECEDVIVVSFMSEYIPEPLGVYHIREAVKKRVALVFDLLGEAVVRHAEDILELVVPRDGDVASVWLEVDRPRDAKFCAYTERQNRPFR